MESDLLRLDKKVAELAATNEAELQNRSSKVAGTLFASVKSLYLLFSIHFLRNF